MVPTSVQSPLSSLLDSKTAAAFLGLSIPTLERMRCNGSGPPFIRLGKGKRARIAYRLSDLEAWLADNTFRSTAEYQTRQ